MIVENYPELANLDAEEKLILAGELWKSATSPKKNSPELSAETVRMLEERLAHFEENPNTGVKWDVLRDRETAK